jgi:hypothetical protein
MEMNVGIYFCKVMETLENNGHLLHGEFVYILSDDSLDVIEGIAGNVPKILKVLTNGKIISPEQSVRTFTVSILERSRMRSFVFHEDFVV